MKTDHQTEVQSVRDIIRAFLDLPPGALPAAQHMDDEPLVSDPWEAIRDYMLPEVARQYRHDGDTVRLRADRPEWQQVYVELV